MQKRGGGTGGTGIDRINAMPLLEALEPTILQHFEYTEWNGLSSGAEWFSRKVENSCSTWEVGRKGGEEGTSTDHPHTMMQADD